MKLFSLISLAIVFVAFFTSCGDIKKLQYMQGEIDSVKISKINFHEPLVQKGDIIGITVYSDNQLASSLFNPAVVASSVAGVATPQSNAVQGYLVDQDGNIQLYGIGRFHVEGVTKKQLADTLVKYYIEKNLLTSPYVEVRFLNFKITLMGDVMHPGAYSIPTDKISILDAIGLAGDLTNYARRDNILVIRETNGIRQFGRLDLSKTDFFDSPFYYLQQNDIVVVDVAKAKAGETNQNTVRNITVAASVLSTIAIFLSVFRK